MEKKGAWKPQWKKNKAWRPWLSTIHGLENRTEEGMEGEEPMRDEEPDGRSKTKQQ